MLSSYNFPSIWEENHCVHDIHANVYLFYLLNILLNKNSYNIHAYKDDVSSYMQIFWLIVNMLM